LAKPLAPSSFHFHNFLWVSVTGTWVEQARHSECRHTAFHGNSVTQFHSALPT